MVFSSITFLYLFLPACLVACFLSRKNIKFQNIVLCIFSFIFYASCEPIYIILLILSIVMNYIFGLLLSDRDKIYLTLGVIFNIALIFIFKYLNLIVDILCNFKISSFTTNIALPIGISFYTFQSISYIVDVYRGDVKPERNFLNLFLYISMFPQLVAGPIVRYKTIDAAIKERSVDFSDVYVGIKRLVIGLGKKVLLANNLVIVVDKIFANEISALSISGKVIGIVLFVFELYFDFSGYSDMAIGIGKMLGFPFPENFDYPLISKSITEFWRRWHMSLGTFFRDYVYIPLGGNKKNKYINIFIVWLLTGIWHGAKLNFVLWGIFLAIVIIFERMLKNVIKIKENVISDIFGNIYFIFISIISFSIFYFEDMKDLCGFYTFKNNSFGLSIECIDILRENVFLIAFAIIASTKAIEVIGEYVRKKCDNSNKMEIVYRGVEFAIILGIFIVSTIFLIGNTNNPFLYTKF